MIDDEPGALFPDPSRTSKKLIGQPGHDSDSSWASFCKAYCGPGAAHLRRKYPNDTAHIDDAIQETLLRIRREQGLHYDHKRFHLSLIFCRRLEDEMYDIAKRQKRILALETDFQAKDAVLRQPSRRDLGNPLQDLTDDTAADINREIVSGEYKRRRYADQFDNQEVLIWSYLLKGVPGVEIVRLIGEGCTSSKITRVKQDFPIRIVRLARERIQRHMRDDLPL